MAQAQAIDLIVPQLGESITEAVISRWLKGVGEATSMDEPVAELETDKVTVMLPAPSAGVLSEQRFAAGSTVRVGDVIGLIAAGAVAAVQKAAPAAATTTTTAATAATTTAAAAAAPIAGPTTVARPAAAAAPIAGPVAAAAPIAGPVAASPSPSSGNGAPARASEPAASPTQFAPGVTSGVAPASAHGRAAEAEGRPLSPAQRKALFEHDGAAPAAPLAPSSAPGRSRAADPAARAPAPVPTRDDEEVVAMTPLRRTIAARLVEAQHTAAILTTFNEIDMSAVIDLRSRHQDEFTRRHGVKLGYMSFFAKAAVHALRDYPGLNAEMRGSSIVYKRRYDIGIAVGGGKGLVVPVVRSVDRLSFADLEKAIADLGLRAKESRLTLDELSGGTFTITNGGIYGSMMSTPLLNMPQTGILGMHNIVRRPTVAGSGEGEQVVIRPMMYVALSYDHRVVDGREAVQFLVAVKQHIEAPERLIVGL